MTMIGGPILLLAEQQKLALLEAQVQGFLEPIPQQRQFPLKPPPLDRHSLPNLPNLQRPRARHTESATPVLPGGLYSTTRGTIPAAGVIWKPRL